MQIYALDASGSLVTATMAQKNTSYFCPECHTLLKLRGGHHRRLHFYHVHSNASSTCQGKSATHLALQLFVQRLFGPDDCLLEKPFPAIDRIADCYWKSKKCVIEIQCSPITAQEVSERMEDYASLKLDMIWILHDATFNQRKVSGAEAFLRPYTFLYTDWKEEGEGMFYQQLCQEKGGIRLAREARLPVSLLTLHPIAYHKDSLWARLKRRLFRAGKKGPLHGVGRDLPSPLP